MPEARTTRLLHGQHGELLDKSNPIVDQRAKGSEIMKRKPIEYESEGYIEENPTDEIWVMDGRGKMIKLEVDDDVGDD